MPHRERASILKELSPPFVVSEPDRTDGTGRVLLPPFRTGLPARLSRSRHSSTRLTLRKSEDCYVDELFASGDRTYGAPLLAARFPRAYLDVNREPYELDPELFDEPLPDFANPQTMRVVGGLGTIARIVSDTEEIYGNQISLSSAMERIEHLYKPIHAALKALLEKTRDQFGYAILVDCHSMPSSSTNYPAAARPEFVIGDRFGTSCDTRLTRMLKEVVIPGRLSGTAQPALRRRLHYRVLRSAQSMAFTPFSSRSIAACISTRTRWNVRAGSISSGGRFERMSRRNRRPNFLPVFEFRTAAE